MFLKMKCMLMPVLQRRTIGFLRCLVLSVTILLHVTIASGRTFNFLHSDHLNGHLCSKGIREQAVAVSELDCARKCTSDPLCVSFIYNAGNSSCHMYNKSLNIDDDCVEHAQQNYLYYKLAATTTATTATIPTTTPTPTTTCPATPNNVEHTYVACYNDNRRRILPYGLKTDLVCLTIEACKLNCHGLGYTYFGVEGGKECFCGNVIKDGYNIRPETECSSLCRGDSSPRCGGHWRISIFQTVTAGA
ncbi:WSC domain-containing protein ARB_07867-like isoform X2 [Haliotis rubra]|uniref:WSC domain-containing protein ARB_07867-like isoform X1 n=1 Tax=Haliotis rubra TaxID=36100 RepID=UPI001EE5597D|nr:WSC domain-containing protein ARB_07867-like isoform X1 [Haliotis rubra]XP_046580475.1 WSC domain-containing protein ARB_07867-like isoform X2 [Haliotis rubra]